MHIVQWFALNPPKYLIMYLSELTRIGLKSQVGSLYFMTYVYMKKIKRTSWVF